VHFCISVAGLTTWNSLPKQLPDPVHTTSSLHVYCTDIQLYIWKVDILLPSCDIFILHILFFFISFFNYFIFIYIYQLVILVRLSLIFIKGNLTWHFFSQSTSVYSASRLFFGIDALYKLTFYLLTRPVIHFWYKKFAHGWDSVLDRNNLISRQHYFFVSGFRKSLIGRINVYMNLADILTDEMLIFYI